MVEVCNSPVGRLGLSICYDARFPQLYQTLRFDHDAEILLVSKCSLRKLLKLFSDSIRVYRTYGESPLGDVASRSCY